MWTETFHRFENEAAFLAACDAAGWGRGPDNRPMPPGSCNLDIIGPIVAPPQVGPNGMPIAGQTIDTGFHFNAAWHALTVPESFQASVVEPAAPQRMLSLPAVTDIPPPVPAVIPAWKGKAALREAGLLDAVEDAVAAAGGRIQDAWTGASVWERASDYLTAMAAALGMTSGQVDKLFQDADAIQG